MKPAGQMILCEKLLEAQSKGGILIPATARDSADTAKVYRMRVVAYGPGIAHAPGSPPVRRQVDDCSAPFGEAIQRLTCQEIVGQPFDVGDVLLCSRYNYNCDVDSEQRNELGERVELRLVRAEDVLGVES